MHVDVVREYIRSQPNIINKKISRLSIGAFAKRMESHWTNGMHGSDFVPALQALDIFI